MRRWDVDAMLAEMTAGQLAEWEAFYLLEPWGADVEDHRAGVIAATVANYASMRKGEPMAPAQFFPSRIPEKKASVSDQVMAALMPLAKKGEP